MKTIDKIILYLDGQMDEAERLSFEKELESSSVLREKLDEYKNLMSEIDGLKNIPDGAGYFVNMIPQFRENLDKKKKYKIIPKLALGITTISAAVVIFFFSFNHSSNKTVTFSQSTVDTEPAVYTLNYSPLQDQFGINYISKDDALNIDSTLTLMLSDELDLSSQSVNELTTSSGTTDLQSMLQGINEDEANQIYNELLHKRIY